MDEKFLPSPMPTYRGYIYERYTPSAYSSSMSIYEELVHIREYLNQVINHLNGTIGYVDANIKSLHEQMDWVIKELERFEAHITNVTLPDNIAKILNEWYENGRLADIINQQVFNMKPDKSGYFDDRVIASFVDDDGSNRFYTVTKPVFDEQQVKATLGVITSFVGTEDYMTKERLTELQTQGFEIVSHSKTHSPTIFRDNLPNVPVSSINEEYRDSQNWLKNNNFEGWDTIVYPFGNFGVASGKYKGLARQFYRLAINSTGGSNNTPNDDMYISRIFLNFNEDFETTLKPKIDDAIAKRQWIIFGMHSGFPGEINAEYVRQVILYLKTKSVQILPVRKALAVKENVLSYGDYESASRGRFFLGRNGKIVGGDDVGKLEIKEGLGTVNPLSKDITLYPEYKLTMEQVRNTDDTMTTEGGTVTTYRGGLHFSYQEFVSAMTSRKFIRKYDSVENKWLTWEEVVKKKDQSWNVVTGIYSGEMDDLIGMYPVNRTTVTQISTTKDTLTGEGGLMVTHRGGSNFSRQTFMSIGKNRIFNRVFLDASGKWDTWIESANKVDVGSKYNKGAYTGTMDDPITSYEKYKLNVTQITSAKDNITNSGGVLETFYGDLNFSYQRFNPINDSGIYVRRWKEDSGTPQWTTWKKATLS